MNSNTKGGSAPQPDSERASLHALAEFLGRLLLCEMDGKSLEIARDPEVSAALGVELPSTTDQTEWLELRAAEYHDAFLRPEGGPMVQSLWTQGRYEGDAAIRVRELARFAGVEYQPSAARGAAPDHLGSLLLLWSASDGEVQSVADEIVKAHLEWAFQPLTQVESQGGFYGRVASLVTALLHGLMQAAPSDSSPVV